MIFCLGVLSLPAVAAEGSAVSASFSVRSHYDDNVFLQDNAPLAPGQSAAALPDNGRSFIVQLGARIGFVRKYGPAAQLEASYAPEVFRYSRYQSENHTDHRFSLGLTGAAGTWSYETRAGWTGTAGSDEPPIFNRVGGAPPVGSEPVRARRAQDIGKVSGRVTRTFRHGFARGVVADSEQNFHTREHPTAGCANYVDRGEWTAGADLGWALQPDFFLVAAARGGRQHQADLLGVPLNYSNTLTRWLLGAEGRLTESCRVMFLAGPDERRFGPHVRPGFDRRQNETYWEANAAWAPTKIDSITVSARHCVWLASGGRGAYVDTLADLGWKRALAKSWTLTTGLGQHIGDIGRYNPTAPRHDTVWAMTGGLSHPLDAKTRLELTFAQDWSVSTVPNTSGREYHRRVWSLGYSRRW